MSRKLWIAGLLACFIIVPELAGARPLTENDLLSLLVGGVYSGRVAMLVRERGIAFSPTKRDLEMLQHAGADEELQGAIVAAHKTRTGRDALEPAEMKPTIIWHRVNGRWRWHCVAHCSNYRTHHAEP